MNFTEDFNQALQDYVLLLEKKYPQKTILELVSTRYNLNHFERSMLYRGISRADKAETRRTKLVKEETIKDTAIHIDLYNALFTIAAYLRGYPVYLANDGILRDASESHGCSDWIGHLEKGLELMIHCLDRVRPAKAIFYIDNLMEHCRKVVEKIHEHCRECGIDHEIILHDSPDHLLDKATGGILASSDSTVIDRSVLPVMDLPRAVLEFHFDPKFIDLSFLTEFHKG
jgi:hypothetical protein